MVEAKLNAAKFYGLLAVLCVFTLGLGAIVVYVIHRNFVATLDDNGVTTRAGSRHAWSDLKTTKIEYGEVGRRRLMRIVLEFGTGKVVVAHRLYTNGLEVVEKLRAATRQAIPMNKAA
jgi:hypothetical protein